MKTIQIIDLFNMYARGGQQVKSIIYKDKNYIYDGNILLLGYSIFESVNKRATLKETITEILDKGE